MSVVIVGASLLLLASGASAESASGADDDTEVGWRWWSEPKPIPLNPQLVIILGDSWAGDTPRLSLHRDEGFVDGPPIPLSAIVLPAAGIALARPATPLRPHTTYALIEASDPRPIGRFRTGAEADTRRPRRVRRA